MPTSISNTPLRPHHSSINHPCGVCPPRPFLAADADTGIIRTSCPDYQRILTLFMQNEPNFKSAPKALTNCATRTYKRNLDRTPGENEPKTNPIRTQTNPIYRGAAAGEAGTNPISDPCQSAKIGVGDFADGGVDVEVVLFLEAEGPERGGSR